MPPGCQATAVVGVIGDCRECDPCLSDSSRSRRCSLLQHGYFARRDERRLLRAGHARPRSRARQRLLVPPSKREAVGAYRERFVAPLRRPSGKRSDGSSCRLRAGQQAPGRCRSHRPRLTRSASTFASTDVVPARHPSSRQSRTPRWSAQRLDGRRRAASRDWRGAHGSDRDARSPAFSAVIVPTCGAVCLLRVTFLSSVVGGSR